MQQGEALELISKHEEHELVITTFHEAATKWHLNSNSEGR